MFSTSKVKLTAEGGVAILMVNGTGGTSVVGNTVALDTSNDSKFILAPTNAEMPIGVVYNAVADGASAWIVVAGIASVLFKDGVAPLHGSVAFSSSAAGRADCSATLPGVESHNREIGHCMESKSAGTNVVANCLLHWN